MSRKHIFPAWIRFFSWIFLLNTLVIPMMFIALALDYPVSVQLFGVEADNFKEAPLLATFASLLLGLSSVVAYGILWGKDWAIKLGIIYSTIAIITACVGVVDRWQSNITGIPVDVLFLIGFLYCLISKRKAWSRHAS